MNKEKVSSLFDTLKACSHPYPFFDPLTRTVNCPSCSLTFTAEEAERLLTFAKWRDVRMCRHRNVMPIKFCGRSASICKNCDAVLFEDLVTED